MYIVIHFRVSLSVTAGLCLYTVGGNLDTACQGMSQTYQSLIAFHMSKAYTVVFALNLKLAYTYNQKVNSKDAKT